MERMSLDINKMTKDQLRQHILMLAMQLTQLEKENKNLKEDNKRLREGVDAGQKLVEDLISKNKKLKEAIKDHQLYEEKLEHRIIEFEELLHGE